MKKRPRDANESSNNIAGSTAVSRRKRARLIRHSFSSTSPIGKIEVVVPLLECGTLHGSGSSRIHEVGFSFSPQSEICSTSIHGCFTKVMSFEPEPRTCAQLNCFKMVEDISPHFYLMCIGTLKEIDTALREGMISPYDVDERRGNLCFYVRILPQICRS